MLVQAADPDGWFVAGRQPTEAWLCAVWLDIKITAGSNTKAETASFVAAAFDAILCAAHEEGSVRVHAVDGDAYGYGGRTQNGRWAAASR